ncbi:MAG: hypothetical protein QOI73_3187, partial [Solirubrobacteraceae bacterium]|nr:hypothetical protein [Solirubrobacteraceae bacterium]
MQGRAPLVVAGLLEREPELERLESCVAAAVAGAGSVVGIEGEAGIGKSSLLAHAVECAGAAGMRVLTARGGELEREFAYGLVRQLFEVPLASACDDDRDRWLSGAAGLAAPVLSAAAPFHGTAGEPSSILHGLYWLAANISVEQPLLIAVDDAHWGDDASVDFLCYLARRADELAVLIAYASRVGEGASDALPAVAEPGLVRSVLRPAALTRAGSTRLVEQMLARESSPAFVHGCHVATTGNPFLLEELLRALDADGILPEDDNAARVEQIAPRTIARATLARLRRLGPQASELAFAVAVLGRSAELRHAAELAGLDCDVAAEAADRLAAASILREARPLEFIHPIVRTTIYGELAPGRRAAGHKRAARLLAEDGAGAVAVAPHLLATEPSGDPWVVQRLRAAAREVLQRGAAEAACTYLERAHREPAQSEQRLELLLELGSAELMLARPTAAARLREVLAGARDVGMRLHAAHELAWALSYENRMDEAVALGIEALADVPPEDAELMLRFEGELAARAQFAQASAKGALERLARYEGRLKGETQGEQLVLAALAFGAAHREESKPAAELAQLALGGGGMLHDDDRRATANFFLAVWALVYADRLGEAERHFDLAIEQARARGSAANFGAASACRCQVLIRQGRLAEAETEGLSILSSASRLHAMARSMLLSCLMHTLAERSDPRQADAFLREHDIGGDLGETAMAGMLLFSRGHLHLAAGDGRAALADFEQLRRRDELSGLDTPGIPVRAGQALAHLQLGEHEAARTLAEEELERARRWDTPSALGIALRTAGLVAGREDGIELLRESVAALDGAPARYEHARSLTELGAALRRAGRR